MELQYLLVALQILASSHAAMKHLIIIPYHLMVAISGVYGLRWECKAVRLPFLPQFLFIQNSDLTKGVHKGEYIAHIHIKTLFETIESLKSPEEREETII